jgi:hypothetical protein
MTTTVEVERSGTFEAIDYQDFKIELGTSVVQVAPTAEILTVAQESTQPAQRVRITIDGTRRFEGVTRSAGKIRQNGSKELTVEHDVVGLMDESVDVSLSSPTDQEVLRAALDNSNRGGTYTLDFVPSATTLSNDYDVSGRQVKRIFRDIMDRTGYVWRVDPTGETVHVETRGGRGLWQSFDAQTDNIGVVSFDDGSAKSVINDVEVIGTGGEAVSATASDSSSISTYGRRTGDSPYKISYVTTQTEAQSVADSILQPDPLPAAEILVGANAGTVDAPQINQTVDLTDATKDISAPGLTITKQTIEQGRATLNIGGDAGGSIERVNRNSKSQNDVTDPGSVYNSDRIADDAIQQSKLADLAVSLQKVQDGAIDTVKISDDAVEAPKVLAGTLTANEIAANTLTANEITSGTITALEIAADTLTANEIDVLDLDTQELKIGTPDDEKIIFEVNTVSNTDIPVMRPLSDVLADIGNNLNRFRRVFAETFDGGSIVISGGIESTFAPDGVGSDILVITANSSQTSLQPRNDNSCFVGTSIEAFSEMHAHNFVTASPDPIDSVDCDGLCDIDWYENPPGVVRQRARELGPTDSEIPGGRDHAPVELGTMANWLLETCKAQQDRIDSLEERLSAIEAKL